MDHKNPKKTLAAGILVLCLLIGLIACGGAPTAEAPEKKSPENRIGFWSHTEYPDAFCVFVYENNGDTVSFVAEASRYGANGNISQITYIRQEAVTLRDGVGAFDFTDTFGNSGTGTVTLKDGKLSLSFTLSGEMQGMWCIDRAAGSYTKTKELSETVFNPDDYR